MSPVYRDLTITTLHRVLLRYVAVHTWQMPYLASAKLCGSAIARIRFHSLFEPPALLYRVLEQFETAPTVSSCRSKGEMHWQPCNSQWAQGFKDPVLPCFLAA
jgi:hypothetical protein